MKTDLPAACGRPRRRLPKGVLFFLFRQLA